MSYSWHTRSRPGQITSTPTIRQFDPTVIPFQIDVISYIRQGYDFSQGTLDILLSGTIGSSKSLLLAHLICTHAILYPGAGILVGRRTLKDLKNTLWALILEHYPILRRYLNKSEMKITLPNKSVIYGVSWDDGKYDKFRSYLLSMAVVEEITENDDKEIHDEIFMRVGRVPWIKESIFIAATNPAGPSHWAYKHYMTNANQSRRVFYSSAKQNPFLPATYISTLERTLDPKMARRMLYGEWIEIYSEMIYHSFGDHNCIRDYKIKPGGFFGITFDFNIGEGKPMSACLAQIFEVEENIYNVYYFKEFIVDGARTMNILEEMDEAGVFTLGGELIVFGDASGKHRDTRNIRSDYDIIDQFIANHPARPNYRKAVPLANPAIRTRHNKVNAALKNALGEVRLFIDEIACPTIVEGFRLTALKKGGAFVEDDSKRYQHVTTAIGYLHCALDAKLHKRRVAKVSSY